MIAEFDLVALLNDLPQTDLKRGDVGTVVHVYDNAETLEVQFINATGETLAVHTSRH